MASYKNKRAVYCESKERLLAYVLNVNMVEGEQHTVVEEQNKINGLYMAFIYYDNPNARRLLSFHPDVRVKNVDLLEKGWPCRRCCPIDEDKYYEDSIWSKLLNFMEV